MRFNNVDEYREDAIHAAEDFEYADVMPDVFDRLATAADCRAIADIMRACRKMDVR